MPKQRKHTRKTKAKKTEDENNVLPRGEKESHKVSLRGMLLSLACWRRHDSEAENIGRKKRCKDSTKDSDLEQFDDIATYRKESEHHCSICKPDASNQVRREVLASSEKLNKESDKQVSKSTTKEGPISHRMEHNQLEVSNNVELPMCSGITLKWLSQFHIFWDYISRKWEITLKVENEKPALELVRTSTSQLIRINMENHVFYWIKTLLNLDILGCSSYNNNLEDPKQVVIADAIDSFDYWLASICDTIDVSPLNQGDTLKLLMELKEGRRSWRHGITEEPMFPNSSKITPSIAWKKYEGAKPEMKRDLQTTKFGFSMEDAVVPEKGKDGIEIKRFLASDEDSFKVFPGVYDPLVRELHPAFNEGNMSTTDYTAVFTDLRITSFERLNTWWIVRSSVSLLRSIRGFPFSPFLKSEDRQKICEIMQKVAESMGCHFIPLHTADAKQKEILDQYSAQLRKPSSYAHDEWPQDRAIIVGHEFNKNKQTVVKVNYNEHLEICCQTKGGALKQALVAVLKMEKEIQENLNAVGYSFSFHEKYGYTNSNIAHIGLGLAMRIQMSIPFLQEHYFFPEILEHYKLKSIYYGRKKGISFKVLELENHAQYNTSEMEILNRVYDAADHLIEMERCLQSNKDMLPYIPDDLKERYEEVCAEVNAQALLARENNVEVCRPPRKAKEHNDGLTPRRNESHRDKQDTFHNKRDLSGERDRTERTVRRNESRYFNNDRGNRINEFYDDREQFRDFRRNRTPGREEWHNYRNNFEEYGRVNRNRGHHEFRTRRESRADWGYGQCYDSRQRNGAHGGRPRNEITHESYFDRNHSKRRRDEDCTYQRSYSKRANTGK